MLKVNRIYWPILIIAALIVGCLAGAWYGSKQERQNSTANLIAVRDSVDNYIIEVNGLKLAVSEKDAVILSEKEAKEAAILEAKRLKALHIKEVVTNTELQGTIKILRDSLKLKPGTIIVTIKDTTGISHDYVKIPFTLLDIKEPYLTLNAGMNVNRTAYFGLSVPVSGTMTIGYKKSGFLKTKPVGVFTSENPYLHIDNMDILIVQERKKWYQYWYVHALAGIIVYETGRQLIK
jgi:hypothetical protein